MRITEVSLQDYLSGNNLNNMMYRVDKDDTVKTYGSFIYPPFDKPFYTGKGCLLHFWTNIDDAIKYARDENGISYVYAVPKADIKIVVKWNRNWMSKDCCPIHVHPTLILQVCGYTNARDEIVIPGIEGELYVVENMFKIAIY